jgi:hypothetical protein
MGDSAIFAQSLSRNNGLSLDSVYLSSMTKFLFSIYGSSEPVSLESLPKVIEDFPIMENHSYLILYLLKPFSMLIPFAVLDALVSSLIFVGPTVLVYLVFRKFKPQHKNTKFLTVCFLLVVWQFPGNIWQAKGQFYPDKLSIILLPLVIMSVESAQINNKAKLRRFFLIAILAILVTERSALYVALISLVYGAFRIKKSKRFDKESIAYLSVSAVSGMYSVIYIKFFTQNPYSDGYITQILNYKPSFNRLLNDGSISLLLFVLPILILIYKEFDLLVILLLGTLPYLMATMGGAEKYGWMTHYLSYLTGIIVGVISASLARTLNSIVPEIPDKKKKLKKRKSPSIIPSNRILLAFFTSTVLFLSLNPFSPTLKFSLIGPERLGTLSSIIKWYTVPSSRSEIYKREEEIREIISQIPSDASVTVTEITAPWLTQRNSQIFQLPLGLNSSKYLLLESMDFNGIFSSPVVPLPLAPQNSIELTNEITKYALSGCFELKMYQPSLNVFLFSRITETCAYKFS